MHYWRMNPRDELVKEIKAFLKETGMAPSTFGEQAISDRALMIRLAAGRDLKAATIVRIRQYMERVRANPRPKKAA